MSDEAKNELENARSMAKGLLHQQREKHRLEASAGKDQGPPLPVDSPPQKQRLCEDSTVTGLKFNPILTCDLWTAIAASCDLSYAASALARYGPRDDQEKRKTENLTAMKLAGFETYTEIWGFTGAENETKDVTCITSLNSSKTVLLIAFHGSISMKGREAFSTEGDWGSNFNAEPTKASELQLTHIPGDVEMHRGFGNNYRSVQEELNAHIKKTVEECVEDKSAIWVIVLGHSKGGGMASIAAPAIRLYLHSVGLTDVNVALVTFSAPRALNGGRSQAWAHGVLGIDNMLRVHVEHDLVVMTPTNENTDYRHVGLHFLDTIEAVHERENNRYGKLTTFLSSKYWVSLHYGNNYRFGGSAIFDPNTTLTHAEFIMARELASKHDVESGIYSTF